MTNDIVSEPLDSVMTMFTTVRAEDQGRLFAIISVSLDRIKWISKNGSGVSSNYKIVRINEIIAQAELDIKEVIS